MSLPKIRNTLKTTTKYSIPILFSVLLFNIFNLSTANAATLTDAATTTSVVNQAATTATLSAAEQAAVEKAAAAAKKAAIKAKKVAKAKAERNKVIKIAKANRGIRYTYGGASPSTGFDCSGFTKYVYKKAAKMTLPHSANAQSKLGKRISKAKAKPGDLVIYSYPYDRNFHVAIYLSKTKVIHAKWAGTTTQIGNLDWGGSETRTYVDVIDPQVGL